MKLCKFRYNNIIIYILKRVVNLGGFMKQRMQLMLLVQITMVQRIMNSAAGHLFQSFRVNFYLPALYIQHRKYKYSSSKCQQDDVYGLFVRILSSTLLSQKQFIFYVGSSNYLKLTIQLNNQSFYLCSPICGIYIEGN